MDYRGKRKRKKKGKKKKVGTQEVVSDLCKRVDVREIRKINYTCTCQQVVLKWYAFCLLL